jgi:hypothetical protein
MPERHHDHANALDFGAILLARCVMGPAQAGNRLIARQAVKVAPLSEVRCPELHLHHRAVVKAPPQQS